MNFNSLFLVVAIKSILTHKGQVTERNHHHWRILSSDSSLPIPYGQDMRWSRKKMHKTIASRGGMQYKTLKKRT